MIQTESGTLGLYFSIFKMPGGRAPRERPSRDQWYLVANNNLQQTQILNKICTSTDDGKTCLGTFQMKILNTDGPGRNRLKNTTCLKFGHRSSVAKAVNNKRAPSLTICKSTWWSGNNCLLFTWIMNLQEKSSIKVCIYIWECEIWTQWTDFKPIRILNSFRPIRCVDKELFS